MSSATLHWLASVFAKANKDPELEFETKFCDQFQGLVSEDPSAFQVGVNSGRFNEIKAHFEQSALIRTTEKETVQYLNRAAVDVYSDVLQIKHYHPSNLRIIKNNSTQYIISKARIPTLPDGYQSVFPEGFKMNLCKEHVLSDEDAMVVQQAFSKHLPDGVFTVRKKDRVSYTQRVMDSDRNLIPFMRVDLTTTTTTGNSLNDDSVIAEEIRHEIELEYIGNKNPDGGTETLDGSKELLLSCSKMFFDMIQSLLCLIHNSGLPLNVKQHNAVIKYYLEAVGENDPYVELGGSKVTFVGCQPESLHERHLPMLVKEPYFVTSKTDGDRFQLIAIPVPSASEEPFRLRCYIIDRWLHVLNVGLRISIPREAAVENGIQDGFLLDGEVVKSKTKMVYWPFDVLRVGTSDMRPKFTYRRIECLKTIVDVIQQYGIQISNRLLPMTVMMKEFYSWPQNSVNAGDIVKLLQAVPGRPSDGLVFMKDEPHPRRKNWPGLFKWKGQRSTVDLLLSANDAKKRWDLLAGGNFATIKQDNSRCLILKKVSTEHQRDVVYWVVLPSGAIIQQNSRDLIWSDTRSAIPFPFCPFIPKFNHIELEDGMVYEFFYDAAHNTLIPHIKRPDKSLLGLDGANDLRVAVDVWESMKYPVSKEQLLSLTALSVNSQSIARVVNRNDYPYVNDFHPSYNWPSLFSNPSTTMCCDAQMKPSELEMHNLKLLHNRIKQRVIGGINVKRVATVKDVLIQHGGVLASSRDANKRQREAEQEWCLPKTALNIVTGVLGVSSDLIRTVKDRIYVNDSSLAEVTITQPRHSLIVVDLCCGKGGDLGKYVKNGVTGLVGVDNEHSLLVTLKDSALNRWAETRTKRRNGAMDACFVLADCRQPLLEVFQHRGLTLEADVVGCFFALHYFFSTENDARSILQNVKDLLKPDGVFIGTLVDGELLLEKLRQHDGVYHHKIGNSTPLFTVCPVNFELDNPPVFGAHIDVELASSILEQYETSNGSKQENLVNFNALVDLASEYDLELIQTETFNQFFPDFPDITLSPEMAAYSSIHRSFRFRKISRSKLGPVQGVIQNIQRLEHQQLESRTVNDDRGATRAADMAYHVSSIVGKLDVKQTDHQADDQPPVQPSPPKRVSFQESKVIVKLKKPKLEPMKEEPKSLAKEPMQEEPIKEEPMKEEPIKEEPVTRAKRSRTVKKEEPIKDEPITDEPVKDEPKVGCGARCRLGNCKACVCRRKNQSKCDDDCGCSPHTCTNR